MSQDDPDRDKASKALAILDNEGLTLDDAVEARKPTESQLRALRAYHRARESQSETKQVRIDTVLDLMTRGEWNSQAARELQKQWGCGIDAINQYAMIASACQRRLMSEDKDITRAIGVAALEALRVRCEESSNPKDRANEVKVLELLARIHGWEAPKQVEMTHKVPTREEAIAELREAAKHDPTILDAIGVPIPESE